MPARYRTVPLAQGDAPGTLFWGTHVEGEISIVDAYERLCREITVVDMRDVHINIYDRRCIAYCWVAPLPAEQSWLSV